MSKQEIQSRARIRTDRLRRFGQNGLGDWTIKDGQGRDLVNGIRQVARDANKRSFRELKRTIEIASDDERGHHNAHEIA